MSINKLISLENKFIYLAPWHSRQAKIEVVNTE
jgi:hypothetical protein